MESGDGPDSVAPRGERLPVDLDRAGHAEPRGAVGARRPDAPPGDERPEQRPPARHGPPVDDLDLRPGDGLPDAPGLAARRALRRGGGEGGAEAGDASRHDQLESSHVNCGMSVCLRDETYRLVRLHGVAVGKTCTESHGSPATECRGRVQCFVQRIRNGKRRAPGGQARMEQPVADLPTIGVDSDAGPDLLRGR